MYEQKASIPSISLYRTFDVIYRVHRIYYIINSTCQFFITCFALHPLASPCVHVDSEQKLPCIYVFKYDIKYRKRTVIFPLLLFPYFTLVVYRGCWRIYHMQGCEPKVENGSVGFRFLTKKSVGFGRFFKRNRKKTKPKPNNLSVGFSAKPAKWSTFRRVRCAFAGIM